MYLPTQTKTNKPTDPHLEAILSEVKTEGLQEWVKGLTAISTRYTKSKGNQEATDYVFSEFGKLGYKPDRHCFEKNNFGDVCNVVAVKKGNTSSGKMVLVVGHFDSVNQPNAGADDNASGTAGVLEIARIFAKHSADLDIVFLATNAEEQDLKGSRAFVNKLQAENKLKEVRFTMVMDMIGYNMGDRVDLETFEPHREFGNWLLENVPLYTRLTPRLIIPGWGSDHIPFLEKGIPTFLAIDDTDVQTPCYHKACDKIDTIDFAFMTEMVKVNLLAVAKMAKND